MKTSIVFSFIVLISVSTQNQAAVHYVPADYPNVQAAIDASNTSDTVVVAPGRYYENIILNNRDIILTTSLQYRRIC